MEELPEPEENHQGASCTPITRTTDGLAATVKEALVAMKAADASVVIVKKTQRTRCLGYPAAPDIAKKVLARDRAAERVNVH